MATLNTVNAPTTAVHPRYDDCQFNGGAARSITVHRDTGSFLITVTAFPTTFTAGEVLIARRPRAPFAGPLQDE
jgi:hypothetical protein